MGMTIIMYFLLSFTVGYFGRNTRIGWLGWTLMAIFFSPLLTGLFYFIAYELPFFNWFRRS